MSRRAKPIETIFDLIDKQISFLRLLREKKKFKNEQEWEEAQPLLEDAHKGEINENDTLQLLFIMDEWNKWKWKRIVLKFRQKLRRDMNITKRIYLSKGWIAKEIQRSLDSTKMPFEYEDLFGGSGNV